MTVKQLTILFIPLMLLNACGRKVEVREYVEVVQLPQRPPVSPPPMSSTPEDPMRAAPLTVEPILENLPPNHPTLKGGQPPMGEGRGANVMAGRESEVPPPPAVTDLEWDLPPKWTEKAGTGMRIAEFYPEPETPEALVTLIALSGRAGSLDGNVARWRGQIGLNPQGETTLQHLDGKLHFEFLSLVKESQELEKPQTIIAAIYAQPDRTLFLKFMGPTEIVAAHKIDFLQLAGSLTLTEENP